MDEQTVSRTSNDTERWNTACGKLPKSEIIYFCQVIAIYIIIVACIVNLSIGGDKDSLWASMLSGSLGYMLPAPKIQKNKNDALLHDSTQ